MSTTNTDLELARDLLSDLVFAARTLPEIATAQEALRQWLRDHPNEQGMRDGFEVLSHREDFARDREAQRLLVAEDAAKSPALI